MDAHFWLSPSMVRQVVVELTRSLQAWDPANAAQYTVNRDQLLERIEQLDQTLRTRLAPVQDKAFIVFHDAYQYFEQHYQLLAVGSISLDPSRPPGARRVQELRERLRQNDVHCLFTEPQFRPALAQTIVEGQNTRLGELDPLGQDLPPGAEAWFVLMERLSRQLLECLDS
jgi:zinc transport system substrate-binding protein